MTREQKSREIENISNQLDSNSVIYLADVSGLNSVQTQQLRKNCFDRGIKMNVVKNTLLKIAMEKNSKNFESLYEVLKDNTAILLSDTPNVPAKLIKSFRRNADKPILKGAWINEDVYVGDNNLDALVSIKSKEEVIADVVALLGSPIRNVMSSLSSSKGILGGILKSLEERK